MKRISALFVIVSMLCVSIAGAAFSIDQTNNGNVINNKYPINLPTESPEVNTNLLKSVNQNVEKYMNFGEYVTGDQPRNAPKEIEYPWLGGPLAAGDFVEWIIHVNYNDKHFEQEIDINPKKFRDRFLEHPWHYETCNFDVDEDGVDDLDVYYSIFLSQLTNIPEGIDIGSLRTCLRINTADMLDRTAKLEVWSQIKLNYGLLNRARNYESSQLFNGRFNLLTKLFERLKTRFENTRLATLLENLLERISNKFQQNTIEDETEPDIEILASNDDWLAMGIGVSSPEGEKIPIYYEKRFNIAMDNIFSPLIFEHELYQVQTRAPLGLLFGLQVFQDGSSSPQLDLAFELDFDPAIYIRMQWIPRDGYIYYGYDVGSGHGSETRVTFIARVIKGVGDDVELTLIFDNTYPIAQSTNWMSFELTVNPIGFIYKANKKHNIGLLVSSPIFSAKLKLVSIPSSIKFYFDVDLSIQYEQGTLFDAEATGSINLEMNSDLDDFILYYPELSSDEPDVEFFKVSDVPKEQKLEAHTHLRIKNESMVTILGEGYILLDMSSDLGNTKVFYRKADPADPDKLFIYVPSIPGDQEVGATAKLYIDLDDFSNPNNYVFGRAYRTASGNIQEISGYLPGETEPIVRITEIPSDSEAEAKLEWNKLKGYAHASRGTQYNPDPIEVNVDLGTFNLYNYLEIRDGHIDLDFYLAEDGYFGFDTENDMIGNDFEVTDTSTGNQLNIDVDKVNANDLWADWDLDLSEEPIQVEELSFGGELSLLEDFTISATYQGKYLSFDTDWKVGQEGKFSLDFTQDEPIKIYVDDLFPDNPTWDVGGGIEISQEFHFDISWNWEKGENYGDPGYLLINEDTNDPNIDLIFLNITYTPDGEDDPQFGAEVGATDIVAIVYLKWWKGESMFIPMIWWYSHIVGDFYLDLLWNGNWHEDVHLWG